MLLLFLQEWRKWMSCMIENVYSFFFIEKQHIESIFGLMSCLTSITIMGYVKSK